MTRLVVGGDLMNEEVSFTDEDWEKSFSEYNKSIKSSLQPQRTGYNQCASALTNITKKARLKLDST